MKNKKASSYKKLSELFSCFVFKEMMCCRGEAAGNAQGGGGSAWINYN